MILHFFSLNDINETAGKHKLIKIFFCGTKNENYWEIKANVNYNEHRNQFEKFKEQGVRPRSKPIWFVQLNPEINANKGQGECKSCQEYGTSRTRSDSVIKILYIVPSFMLDCSKNL